MCLGLASRSRPKWGARDCDRVLGHDEQLTTAENYLSFSHHEAAGKSPLYAELTAAVARDPMMLAFLAERPPAKRQPNLLLAAVRYLYGVQPDYQSFRSVVLENQDLVADVLEHRRTQTNEPARCAVLLPFLAGLSGPLALLEVGAAAGLCLLADRYGYQYGDGLVGDDEVVFDCELRDPAPAPQMLPEIVWRAGIDLDPVNVRDEDAVRWLHALVWPGQPERGVRLQRAVEIARRDPPRIVRGDLLNCLESVAGDAPDDATLVVFHTAVLAYLDLEQRCKFVHRVQSLDAEWLSNEGPGVTPGLTLNLPPTPADPHFLIGHGSTPVAFCDPHGAWIQRFEP
jgi:hypothetical protein